MNRAKILGATRSKQRNSHRQRQRGVALVTVLFVVALAVILAAEMSGRLQMQIQRTGNLSGARQAYWFAVGAEQLVKQQIKQINDKDSRTNVIHSGQDWAKKGLQFPVDGGTIGGELTDLQACFNLNSLAAPISGTGSNQALNSGNPTKSPNGNVNNNGNKNPNANNNPNANPNRKRGITFEMEAFQRLLEVLEVDRIDEAPPAEYLAQRLKDWLDSDDQQTGGGGMEEGDYMALKIPYLAANTLMTSVSELRLVGGFSPAVIAKIKPYVCVIPGDQRLRININTVDPEKAQIVAALLKGMSTDDARTLISGAQPDGYAKVSDFWDNSEMNQVEDEVKAEAIKYFDVTTEYFELRAQTSFGDSKFYLQSKLHINQSKHVSVIARKFGVDL